MVTQYEIEQWLQEGILAAKAGEIDQARFRLLDVVEQDQTNEAAWFWLYQVFNRHDDKRICLENLILINPYNEWARQELHQYPIPPTSLPGLFPGPSWPALKSAPAKEVPKNQATVTAGHSPRPLTLKIIVAFWFGISVIFLIGGIIASGEWLASTIQARTFPGAITGWQALDLLLAISFVMIGLLSLNVALALFFRSMVGFYGSLLLALGLLLVGPIVSLLARPPNYPAMICLGGMAGMIVLFTLASQPGLKDTQPENDSSTR